MTQGIKGAGRQTTHATSGERSGTCGKWDSENAACPLLPTAFMSTCQPQARTSSCGTNLPAGHENMGAKSDALQLAAIMALFAAGLQYMRFLLACCAPRSSPVDAPLSVAAARTDLYIGTDFVWLLPTQHSVSASASASAPAF
jgi:hypothetical protein